MGQFVEKGKQGRDIAVDSRLEPASGNPGRTGSDLPRMGTRGWITARLVTLARVYFTWLFAWAILQFFGDRWWWLFLANTFAAYLFVPLPAVLAIAFLARRRETWIGFALALALGAYLYGGLFLPKGLVRTVFSRAHADAPTLTVMSYNMLGFNEHPEEVVAAIRAADADVVAMQELNPAIAEAIQRELGKVYPYRALDPQQGVTGSGAISRYPLYPSGETLPGEWVGTPQVLTMDWQGQTVMLLNFHTMPTTLGSRDLRAIAATIERSVREREQQAQAIVDWVSAHPGPIIVLTDFNAGDQSDAYALVTDVLIDAWREGGWGLGHTFPGAASAGSSRPAVSGVPIVPKWLVRIDYVFYSEHWRALSARIGPWDGISDHRPVMATLILR
jgi:vancomycin resistance protein VanJ